MKIRNVTNSLARNVLLSMWLLFAIFPVLWLILMSFKCNADMHTTILNFEPTLENYKVIFFDTDYFKAFLDNILISGLAVLIALIVGVPAAYALARFRFKAKENLAFTILSFRFAPEILVILPIFMIYQKIGLYDTYFGLIWVYQLIALPLIIWVLRSYFEDISPEIEQAAMLDGYPRYRVFFKFLLPIVKPGIVAVSLLSFIFAWNNFTFPLQLANFNVQTVTVATLKYLGSQTVEYGYLAVAATVAIVPEFILALLIQKHLVRGLSFGAVKG